MAAQLALAPEISNETRSSPEALDLLVDAIEALSLARSVEDIAATVRSAARRLSGADGVTVVLREGDRCRYLDEDAIEPLWKGMSFPLEACVSGWAMLNGKTAVIPDIYADPRVPYDAYRPTFVKSMVMTPVRPADPVAAIGAYWAGQREPTAREVELLEAMARVTATAFENVMLYASLKEANERREFLIHELDHRVKNTLASVQGLARQTLRSSEDKESFVESFTGRLQALSRAHVLLTRRMWKNADLQGLATEAVAPLPGRDRVSISGPDIVVTPETSVAMLLAIHELGVNATKFGALSRKGGHVDLTWSVDRNREPAGFVLEWRESGGPAVTAPAARGVGCQWIERGLSHALGGTGKLEFDASGAVFTLRTQLSDRLALA
jgi:two-component sensor histidine kinase